MPFFGIHKCCDWLFRLRCRLPCRYTLADRVTIELQRAVIVGVRTLLYQHRNFAVCQSVPPHRRICLQVWHGSRNTKCSCAQHVCRSAPHHVLLTLLSAKAMWNHLKNKHFVTPHYIFQDIAEHALLNAWYVPLESHRSAWRWTRVCLQKRSPLHSQLLGNGNADKASPQMNAFFFFFLSQLNLSGTI